MEGDTSDRSRGPAASGSTGWFWTLDDIDATTESSELNIEVDFFTRSISVSFNRNGKLNQTDVFRLK